jgi:transcriptional antiterminator RfaH
VTNPSHYFLAQTKPRQEALATAHLLQQGYAVVSPRIPKPAPKRVRSQTVLDQPLFPGYVFLAPSQAQGSVASVRSTVGVRGLVQFCGKPASIRRQTLEGIVDWVQAQFANGVAQAMRLHGLSEGARVRVQEGPFRDLVGLVSNISQDRITVLMQILGREQQLDFSPWALEVEARSTATCRSH